MTTYPAAPTELTVRRLSVDLSQGERQKLVFVGQRVGLVLDGVDPGKVAIASRQDEGRLGLCVFPQGLGQLLINHLVGDLMRGVEQASLDLIVGL